MAKVKITAEVESAATGAQMLSPEAQIASLKAQINILIKDTMKQRAKNLKHLMEESIKSLEHTLNERNDVDAKCGKLKEELQSVMSDMHILKAENEENAFKISALNEKCLFLEENRCVLEKKLDNITRMDSQNSENIVRFLTLNQPLKDLMSPTDQGETCSKINQQTRKSKHPPTHFQPAVRQVESYALEFLSFFF